MSHTWENGVDGTSWLPVERILWAPTNSAHNNHLHVVGLPRMSQDELPTSFQITASIKFIINALDEEFGPGAHYQNNPNAAWTHMGIYNDRYIGGTTIWSQHAGGNAIDIGPYYGVEEQQSFYDFLTSKEEENTMPFTDHEVEELRRIVGELDAVNSNGSFARYTVEHLRALRDGDVSVVDTHARSLANKALNILNAIKEAI